MTATIIHYRTAPLVFFWFFIFFFLIPQLSAQVVLTEIMYDPAGNENWDEFIEIFNLSETDSVDLTGWQVADSVAGDEIVAVGAGLVLQPQQYGLILDPDYFTNSILYDNLIPPKALLLTIDGKTFGQRGMVKSKPLDIFLKDDSGAIISSRKYTLDEDDGHSEEKVIYTGANSDDNWKSSITVHGTPGFANSVMPRGMDLATGQILFFPESPQANQPIIIHITIKNIGLEQIREYRISIFEDLDQNGVGDERERLTGPIQITKMIAPGDSVVVSENLGMMRPGSHDILVFLELDDDQMTNNSVSTILLVGFLPGQVLINEFMYYPASQDEPEWVEIYNPGSDSVNLKDWYIGDNKSSVLFIQENLFLGAGQYAVIVGDSSFFDFFGSIPAPVIVSQMELPKFNNTATDQVIIRDLVQNVIDSVEYKATWGGRNGYTLERIRLDKSATLATNWISSKIPGGTPGQKNSRAIKNMDAGIKLAPVFNPPCPTPDEIVNFSLRVYNEGLNSIDHFTIIIYDDTNNDSTGQRQELLKSISYSNITLISEDSITVEGSMVLPQPGKHTIIFQLGTDENLENNLLLTEITGRFNPGTLLINEFMYNPDSDQPEWVELYNPGNYPVNINGWLLSDSSRNHAVTISREPVLIEPGEFLIITKDSSVTGAFSDLNFKFIVLRGTWPSLNNNKDAVTIYDLTRMLIDSVFYTSSMGGNNNTSLERLFYDKSSLICENWQSSVHLRGATPGQVNSVIPPDYDLAIISDSLTSGPIQPRTNTPISFYLEVRNSGKYPVTSFAIEMYLDANHDSILTVTELISTQELLPETGFSWNEQYQVSFVWRQPLAGVHSVGFKIVLASDSKKDNDTGWIEIAVSRVGLDLVINEIMYDPPTEQPEWFELYNPTDTTINLRGYRFGDAVGVKKLIAGYDIFINGFDYILIAARELVIPVNGTVVIPEDEFPTLNNTEDDVVIYDAAGSLVDSVHYFNNWGGKKGVSLERIWWERTANDSINWQLSCGPFGATPNKQNCASPLPLDLAFLPPGLEYTPAKPARGDNVIFAFFIKNVGRQVIVNGQIILYWDSIPDSIFTSAEKIGIMEINDPIEQEATAMVTFNWNNVPAGYHSMLAVLDCADNDTTDNFHFFDVAVGFDEKQLVLNEIMYKPLPERAEWVELHNPGNEPVYLRNWQFSDSDTTQRLVVSENFIIAPGGYVILATKPLDWQAFRLDSTITVISRWFPSLSNSGEMIYLFDPLGYAIDIFDYSRTVITDVGFSLERINPAISSLEAKNWGQCAIRAGGTPGKKNSLFAPVHLSEKKLTAYPNPFSPDGDGHEDLTIISYDLPMTTSQVNLKIYDIHGRLVRFLCNNEPSGSHRDLPWDGMDNDGRKCRMGIYILYLEAISATEGILERLKETVVIGGNL